MSSFFKILCLFIHGFLVQNWMNLLKTYDIVLWQTFEYSCLGEIQILFSFWGSNTTVQSDVVYIYFHKWFDAI